MHKFLILLPIVNIGFAQDFKIKRIHNSSRNYFNIEKIHSNPMSNPNNMFTNFNLPDTSNILIDISDDKDKILIAKEVENLELGHYQLTWDYKNINDISTGKYNLNFKASKNAKLKYYGNIDFLLLK